MKNFFKVLIITAVLLIISAFPAYAGSISVSSGSVSVAEGSSATIYLNGTNIAGNYSVYTADGSVAYASGSGWIEGYDTTDSVAITISGVAAGNTTVYVEYSVTDVDSLEDYINTAAVSVNVYTPETSNNSNNDGNNDYPYEEEPEPETEPETVKPKAEVVIGDKTYTVLEDISDVQLPSGFEEKAAEYGGVEVSAAVYGDDEIVLYVLRNNNDADDQDFYTYDADTGTFSKLIYIVVNNITYIVRDIPGDYTIPDSFEAAELEIDEEKIPAFQISDELKDSFADDDNNTNREGLSDLYYVYCFYDGVYEMYCYDSVQVTMQRAPYFFVGLEFETEETVTETEPETESETEPETETEQASLDAKSKMLIVIAVAIVLFIAAVVVIIIVERKRFYKFSGYDANDDFHGGNTDNTSETKSDSNDDDFFDDYE